MDAAQALASLDPVPDVGREGRRIGPHALLQDEPREHRALGLARQPLDKRPGLHVPMRLEREQDLTQRRVGDVAGLDERQEGGSRAGDLQEQLD